MMTIGILIMAVGVYFFKFPNNFSTGGVSGLSIIIGRLFPNSLLSPSTVMLLINTLLLASIVLTAFCGIASVRMVSPSI